MRRSARLWLTRPAPFANLTRFPAQSSPVQSTDRRSVATPLNREDGDDFVIVQSIQELQVSEQKFPEGYKALKPRPRVTAQTNR
jgi:hypothetical protein